MESEQMTIADAIARFVTEFAGYGDIYTISANNIGPTEIRRTEKKIIDGIEYTRAMEIDLKKCENNTDIKTSDTNYGSVNHLIHKLYRKNIIVYAQFRQPK